jgi:tetratricopeptide (TPR) repeat protein
MSDLEKIPDSIEGPIDAVIFSGDLVYSGKKEQFERLENVLIDIWEKLETSGSKPLLLPVPGNHDMTRPHSASPVVKALHAWGSDEEIRNAFWSASDNEYRTTLNKSFCNYTDWLNNTNIPTPKFDFGILPGDFSVKMDVNGTRVGFVGLNSSYLQLSSGDYHGRLHLDINQLNAVCGGDPDKWKSDVDLSFLITHHGPDWLDSTSQMDYESEIYSPWMFYCHFFGHMHESRNFNESYSSVRERRYRQGVSMLGLKFWGEQKVRQQGYSFGQISICDNVGVEKLWPRSLIKTNANYYKIVADNNYDLDKNNSLERRFVSDSLQEAVIYDNEKENDIASPPDENCDADDVFVESVCNRRSASISVPTFQPRIEVQHQHIRQIEQAKFESCLRTNRCAWVISDWGLGTEAFIGSVITKLDDEETPRTFILSCEEIKKAADFELVVNDKYDMSLTKFCAENADSRTIWVLDEINPEFVQSDQLPQFETILQTVLDFCPDMMLVMVSRQQPVGTEFETVELKSLDVEDVGNYVFHHPHAGFELRNLKAIDRLHLKSGGLPMHLDRLIEMLQVCELDELSDLDIGPEQAANDHEPVPQALKQAVASLAGSENKYTRRSYMLLQALSLLPHGESLANVKRLVPNEPFFPKNAVELKSAALVQVEDVSAEQLFSQEVETNGTFDGKRLCVPRQVRDYVLSLMTEKERSRLVRAAAETFLGEEYRNGRLTEVKKRQKNRGAMLGNDYSLVFNLIRQARNGGRQAALHSALRAAVAYVKLLRRNNKYKDAVIACEEFLPMVSDTGFVDEYTDLRIVYGESLRMLGEREQAISIFESVLDSSEVELSNSKKTGIYLDLSLIYQSENDREHAIEAAKNVKKSTPKGGCAYFQAESVILHFKEISPERTQNLRILESKARKKRCSNVANNILLELARYENDGKSKLALLGSVLADCDDSYNRVRATIDKILYLVRSESLSEISEYDKKALSEAYSYVFYQRLDGLFNKCHRALWSVAKYEGRIDLLIQMFRFSSFVWRVKGEKDTEAGYFSEIREANLTKLVAAPSRRLALAIKYIELRKEQG